MTAAITTTRTHRAVVLMTASSFLVPLAGIASAPLLTHALGVAGRGEVAAAVAPNVLIASVATFGLPEALVFHLAQRPWLTRRAIGFAMLTSLVLGAAAFAIALISLPYLSAGDATLANLILLATVLVVPVMAVNVFRGAATGRQMWRAVAAEKAASSILRVLALLVLALLGRLDVWTAVIVTTVTPIVSGLVYLRLLGSVPDAENEQPEPPQPLFAALHSFGARIWLGAVANMLLARFGQLFFAPISNTHQLGLYIVAVTISDVPLIVAIAIRDALYGVNSKDRDAAVLAGVCRAVLLVAVLGCIGLGVTLPLWIGPVFGGGFHEAVIPTWILMASTIANIPGFLAAAGLGAWGRPGLRSIGLLIGLVSNVPVFFLLVPAYGAGGAAVAALISSLLSTAFMLTTASRVLEAPIRDFLLIRRSDIGALTNVIRRRTRRGSNA